jgi:hypothetical protein
MWVMKAGGARGVDVSLKVSSEGAGEVEAEGLGGSVAGESGMVGGAEVTAGEEALPRGIRSWDEAVGGGRTGGALISRSGND